MAADLESELRRLQRTYRSSGFRLTRDPDSSVVRVALDFECQHPEYRQQYPRTKSLPLEISIPDDYPSALPVFKVRESQPEQIQKVVAEGLSKFCEKKRGQSAVIIASLKWLDDNLHGLMKLGCDLLNQEQQAKKEATLQADFAKFWTPEQQSQFEKALKAVPKSKDRPPEERWRLIAELVDGKTAADCIARFKEIRTALQAESERQAKVKQITENLQELTFEPSAPAPLPAMEQPKPTSQGVELVFPSIQLNNIAMARVRVARFLLRCARCDQNFDAEFVPTQLESGTCQNCHEQWSAKFTFEIVHVSNCRFGTVHTSSCVILDYLPSDIWVSCAGCSSDLLMERVETGSKKLFVHCRECFLAMTLVCGDAQLVGSSFSDFVLPSGKSEQGTESKKRKERPVRENESLSAVKKGIPLPDFGICKHYAKSYRWLRFPCCGKLFPCDICHELGTASNPHEMKWALRQVCGFCSQESAISGTGKCPCGRSTTRASSEFWNGGKGMRDQVRMNRHDSRKHAGAGKTKSQKHKRVGPKAD